MQMNIHGHLSAMILRVAALFILSLNVVQAATLAWVGGDGAWEDPANWQSDEDPPQNRMPVNGDTIRPVAAGITVTYSATTGAQTLPGTTIWQDSSATTSFEHTGGDLQVNQLYLATLKTDTNSLYRVTGGSLFVNRNLNMTWSNSSQIDSRFVQAGGSVRIGDGNGEGVWMCLKNQNQIAHYDLEGGDFEARNVSLCQGGANSSAYFTQGAGTTAVINQQLILGRTAGTTGEAIYHLNGGELTIESALDPILFFQPGAPVYFDFAGGALNLPGTWDFAALTAIPDADFRVFGIAATAANLNFDSVIVDTVEYTRITAEVTIPIVVKQLMYDRNSDAVTLSWTSQPGKSYEILWSTDLTNYLSSGVVSAHPSDSETLAGPFANPAPGAKRVYFRLGEAATAP